MIIIIFQFIQKYKRVSHQINTSYEKMVSIASTEKKRIKLRKVPKKHSADSENTKTELYHSPTEIEITDDNIALLFHEKSTMTNRILIILSPRGFHSNRKIIMIIMRPKGNHTIKNRIVIILRTKDVTRG